MSVLGPRAILIGLASVAAIAFGVGGGYLVAARLHRDPAPPVTMPQHHAHGQHLMPEGQAMPGMDMPVAAPAAPAVTSSSIAAEHQHMAAPGKAVSAPRPLAAVLSVFGTANAGVLAAAMVLRRRDPRRRGHHLPSTAIPANR